MCLYAQIVAVGLGLKQRIGADVAVLGHAVRRLSVGDNEVVEYIQAERSQLSL